MTTSMRKYIQICLLTIISFGCQSQSVIKFKELNVSQEEMIKKAKHIERLLLERDKTSLSKEILDDHKQSENGKDGYIKLLLKNYEILRNEGKTVNYEDVLAKKSSFDGETFYYTIWIGIRGKNNANNLILKFLETGENKMVLWDVVLAYIGDEDNIVVPELPKF